MLVLSVTLVSVCVLTGNYHSDWLAFFITVIPAVADVDESQIGQLQRNGKRVSKLQYNSITSKRQQIRNPKQQVSTLHY